MLLRIGKRTAPHDLMGALTACHARIRSFADLAITIAAASDAPPAEIAEAARQVRRYFAEALPLHVADEDETLAPLLAGQNPEVDRALTRMGAEHDEHAPLVAELVAIMARLEREPEALAPLRPTLAPLAEGLRATLERHLALEEAALFPAIARLPAALRDRAHDAMRQRRTPPSAASR